MGPSVKFTHQWFIFQKKNIMGKFYFLKKDTGGGVEGGLAKNKTFFL